MIREFFNARADKWDEDVPAVLPSRSAAAVIAGAKPGMRMLDIACGTGVMTAELLALGVSEIVAIDFAEKMIERAKAKFENEPKARFVAGDFLTYQDEPFDAAIMYNAYPHFADKPAVLRTAAGLLKPGARFTVAHGAGRQVINSHHHEAAQSVSVGLGPAKEEAAVWSEWFDVDVLVDTPHIYVISGTKK